MSKVNDPTIIIITFLFLFFIHSDILEGRYKRKIKLQKQPYKAMTKFYFGWKSLAEAHPDTPLPLENAILRTYIEVIPRLLNGRNMATVTMKVFMRALGRNQTAVLSGIQNVTITPEKEDWVEIDVTQGMQQLWPPMKQDRGVEVTVMLSTDCQLCRKLPAQLIDPATIPISQHRRRQRVSAKQSFMVVSLSDEEIKEVVRSQSSEDDAEAQEEVVTVQGSSGASNTREKRSTSACHIEPFSVDFGQIGIAYIHVPASYNAMQCVGSCSHKVLSVSPNRGNNHAKIMAGSKAVYDIEKQRPNGKVFPRIPEDPCCVPTKYDPLPVLEEHADKSIEYNIYPSMIVKACGCR